MIYRVYCYSVVLIHVKLNRFTEITIIISFLGIRCCHKANYYGPPQVFMKLNNFMRTLAIGQIKIGRTLLRLERRIIRLEKNRERDQRVKETNNLKVV